MNAIAIKSLIICIVYGIMSICQTLNSRYLYRNLNFNFYSFVSSSLSLDIRHSKDRHHRPLFFSRQETFKQENAS